MKKIKGTLAVFCFLAGWAAVGAVHADAVSGNVDKNFWIKAYTGYDNATLGDLNSGLQGWNALGTALGLSMSQKTDTSGIAAGGEFGYQLDADDALSVGCENVWGSALEITGTQAATNVISLSYTPSLLDFTLNYYRTLFKGGGAKTLVFIGGGYYAATGTVSMSTPGNTTSGTFNGNALGGVLGAEEEINLGDTFGILITAKGRLATIGKMTSTNITSTNGSTPPGTQDLVITSSPFPGYNLVYGESESTPFTTGTTRLAAQDESGFQGDLAVAVHF